VRRITPALGAVVLAGLLAGCGAGSGRTEGSLKLQGAARISGPEGSRELTRTNGPDIRLRTGDELSIASGSALVSLPSGDRLELRAGSSVSFSGGPDLEAGDLLVEATRGPVKVQSAVGPVTVTGIAKLQRDLAVEIGTYQGQATVVAERTVTVAALQEDTVPAAGLVPDPSPIQLSASDPWDERYLGTAIDLTSELDSQSNYVTANTPPALALSVTFYQHTLPALATTPAFTPALLLSAVPSLVPSSPPPGDALVAAAIALAGPGSFADRWHNVFDLRAEGGQWGVVALAEDASPTTVLNLVNSALNESTLAPPTAPIAISVPGQSTPTPAPAVFSTAPTPNTTVSPPAGKPVSSTHPAAPATTPKPGHPTATTPPPPTTAPPTTIPPPAALLAPILDPVVNLIHALAPGSPK
jgi:hypothetical protein